VSRPPLVASDPVSLRAFIERKSVPVPESGCWIWLHGASPSGYGISGLKYLDGGAHRVSYKAFVGPIPAGYFICHKCDTPPCVNPDHLFLGTHADNMADRQRKGRYIGEWNGRARLDVAQVQEIRRRIAAGEISKYTAARIYGVSKRTIMDICFYKTWSHVA